MIGNSQKSRTLQTLSLSALQVEHVPSPPERAFGRQLQSHKSSKGNARLLITALAGLD